MCTYISCFSRSHFRILPVRSMLLVHRFFSFETFLLLLTFIAINTIYALPIYLPIFACTLKYHQLKKALLNWPNVAVRSLNDFIFK